MRYGGLKVDQARRLKELERENTRLRRAVADLTLEKLVLKEATEGNWKAPLFPQLVLRKTVLQKLTVQPTPQFRQGL